MNRKSPSGVPLQKPRSLCGVGQSLLEVRDPGLEHGRAGHDDDVGRRKAWEKRPERFPEQSPHAIPDDGAADTPADNERGARLIRRFPREMVQDQLGPGHTLTRSENRLYAKTRTEPLLAAHLGPGPVLDGEALPALRAAAANDGAPTGATHALAKAVAALTATVMGLESSLHSSRGEETCRLSDHQWMQARAH